MAIEEGSAVVDDEGRFCPEIVEDEDEAIEEETKVDDNHDAEEDVDDKEDVEKPILRKSSRRRNYCDYSIFNDPSNPLWNELC